MTTVFLDTVGLLAIWDVSDQWHAAAEIAYRAITSRRDSFVTTTFVLLECGNAAARRPYRGEVDRLRQLLEARNELIVPNHDDWIEGWEGFRRGDAAQAGIVDQVSIVVMRRLGIRDAFTNDQHFKAAGFQISF